MNIKNQTVFLTLATLCSAPSLTTSLPTEYKKTLFLLEKLIQKKNRPISKETIIAIQNSIKNNSLHPQQLTLILKSILIELNKNGNTLSTDTFLKKFEYIPEELSSLEPIIVNNKLLLELEDALQNIDTPLYAQTFRNIDSFLESISFYTITKRVAPYVALAAYIQATQTAYLNIFDPKKEGKEGEVKKQAPSNALNFSVSETIGRGLLKIHEKPLLELSIYSLFLPTLKKDASELVAYMLVQTEKLAALLKNKPLPSQKISKKPTVNFDDIAGKQEIKNLFLKNISQTPDSERGFLFVGESGLAKECAYALAGEIKACEIYEMHASALLKENLKETVKKINPQSPLVLIIDNIDWILEEKNYDAKGVAELIETIKALTNKNKKEYIVLVCIADTTNSLNQKFQEETKISSLVYFSKPSLQERYAFFKKKTAKNSAELDQEIDLNYLAGATEGASYEQLTQVYNQAVSSANTNKELLNPSHFEASLDRQIRCIEPGEEQVPLGKKRLLAAHYAGSIVAQKILFPETKIAKATLYLVKTTHNTYKNGALFTYTTHDEQKISSASYLRKKIVYLLAGKEAQSMMHGDYDQSNNQATTQEAYKIAYTLLLQGIQEETLDAVTKEQIKRNAWELYASSLKQAQELVEKNKQNIQKIAGLLEERTTILSKDIDELYIQQD